MKIIRRKRALGAGMLELAIVIPVFLMIIFSGIELTRSIRIHSKLTSLSKELAAAAFRSCGNLANPLIHSGSTASLSGEVDACLARTLSDLSPALSSMIDAANTQISLSVFRTVPPSLGIAEGPTQVATHGYQLGIFQTSSTFPRSSVADFDQLREPFKNQLISDNYVLVYAEVLYKYTPIISPVAQIFNYNGGEFYAVSAF